MKQTIFCRLFAAIEKLHREAHVYSYNEEALVIAKQHYNEQQTFLRKKHNADTFMSGMF